LCVAIIRSHVRATSLVLALSCAVVAIALVRCFALSAHYLIIFVIVAHAN
jgi:hypothetical protein